MRQRGFALFDVLLAVVLMTIAAAGSYTLVKSFRVNSATQQFIRYSTSITQSFTPFLDGGSAAIVLTGDKLSSEFLTSIGIPASDQSCSSDDCYVDSGMYVDSGKSLMAFGSVADDKQNLASYFAIAVQATGAQANQVLQSASSLFSVYCGVGSSLNLSATSSCALLPKSENNTVYSLFLVFPKSGDTAPAIDLTPPALG